MMSLETYRLDTASLSDPVTLNDWIINIKLHKRDTASLSDPVI
jgi:hypothetical protein